MGCKICGCEYDSPRPHCTTCSQALTAKGLCCHCGERPRKSKSRNGQQSRYCEPCQDEFQRRSSGGGEEFTRKYRGPDHRENTRETKGGRD